MGGLLSALQHKNGSAAGEHCKHAGTAECLLNAVGGHRQAQAKTPSCHISQEQLCNSQCLRKAHTQARNHRAAVPGQEIGCWTILGKELQFMEGEAAQENQICHHWAISELHVKRLLKAGVADIWFLVLSSWINYTVIDLQSLSRGNQFLIVVADTCNGLFVTVQGGGEDWLTLHIRISDVGRTSINFAS
eukprot:1155167-Pelagomonas_calceolata.AAC.2